MQIPTGSRTVLALLCAAQFVIVLDATIVGPALPALGADLGLDEARVHWALSAYAIVFGGAVLAGGRVADRLGRRRTFVAGLALFALAAAAAAAAPSAAVLVGARGVQGLGAAVLAAAALALLSISFAEGPARMRAIAVWSTVGGVAAVSGVVLGGALTDLAGWRATLVAHLAVSLPALALAPRLLAESCCALRPRFDAAGAALVTAGVLVLAWAATEAGTTGMTSQRTLVGGGAAVALLALFGLRQVTAPEPLLPRGLLRRPTIGAAAVGGFVQGGTTLALFLLLALHLQQVVGLSALAAGLVYAAGRFANALLAAPAGRLVERLGGEQVLALGLALIAVALAQLARLTPDGSYVTEVLPGLLLASVGITLALVATSAVALTGVAAHEAGAVAGLVNAVQWVGGALALAVATALAQSRADALVAAGAPSRDALAAGVAAGLWACAALAAAGAVAVFAFVHHTREELEMRTILQTARRALMGLLANDAARAHWVARLESPEVRARFARSAGYSSAA